MGLVGLARQDGDAKKENLCRSENATAGNGTAALDRKLLKALSAPLKETMVCGSLCCTNESHGRRQGVFGASTKTPDMSSCVRWSTVALGFALSCH
jgi:hypothetical protein